MESISEILDSARLYMDQSLEHLETELTKVRAGKATPGMVDGLRIDYYGNPTPLNQVANITVSDGRTLNIQPYEKQHIAPIEKVIMEANLGLTPQNDGTIIRLNIPPLTEDRRKQLVKQTKELGEDAKVSIRNVRKDHNNHLKNLLKAGGVSEDEIKRAEDEVQKLTDKHTEKVDALLEHKEKEIMTV